MAYDPNYPFGSYGAYGNYQPRQLNTYAFVNGIEGAKSYIVPVNQTMLLMDSEQPVCYMKQANGLGQSTLRYFKLQEVSEADIRNSVPPTTAPIEYATKADIEGIVKRLEKLEPKGE